MKHIKYLFYLLVVVVSSLFLSSCTANGRIKNFGGEQTINVEKGKKVIMATWDNGNNLLYMVEDMEDDYVPQEKTLIEVSNLGICNSKVIFIESR